MHFVQNSAIIVLVNGFKIHTNPTMHKTPYTVSAIMTDYDYYRKMIEDAKESQGAAVNQIAGGSAAAALVPVPGLDIAVDVTAMIAFANVCLTKFGLTEEALKQASEHIAWHAMEGTGKLESVQQAGKEAAKKVLVQVAIDAAVDTAIALAKRKVYKYLGKKAILALVSKFAVRKAVGTVAKYVPIVGQAVAAGLAFYSTQSALNEILDEMYSTAKEIYLEHNTSSEEADTSSSEEEDN